MGMLEKVDNPVIEKIVHRISKEQISASEREFEAQDSHHRKYYTGICVGCEQAIRIIQDEMKKLDESAAKHDKENKTDRVASWLDDLRKFHNLEDLRKTHSHEYVHGYSKGILDAKQIVEVCNHE